MTEGGDGSEETSISPEGAELSASSRGACGLDGGRENVKPKETLPEGRERVATLTFMLQLVATRSV